VYSARDGRKIRRTFPTITAAKAWRADASSALRKGTLRASPSTTLRRAADAWLEGARAGAIRNRSGDVYKPSVLRGYARSLRTRILPELGAVKLADVRLADVQDLADRMLADGLDPSTIRNTLMPLRVIYRRAVSRGEVAVNPTSGLELPAVRGKRDRVATPDEAAELLEALPDDWRAVWATALYAGLRRGELFALRWENVDLAGGVIRVEWSWDPVAGFVETKNRRLRTVPLAALLRSHLLQHKLRTGRSTGLVFGRNAGTPASDTGLRWAAQKAWKRESQKRAIDLIASTNERLGRAADDYTADELAAAAAKVGLKPIGLHECRHTYVTLMFEAGLSLERIGDYVGHSSQHMTDRYRHLLEGHEAKATQLIDEYLARAGTSSRLAAIEASD
jgi:integrase